MAVKNTYACRQSYEQDVAALYEAEVCQELACTGQQLQESAEESAEEEEDEEEEEEEEQQCEEPNTEEWEPYGADLNTGGLHHSPAVAMQGLLFPSNFWCL